MAKYVSRKYLSEKWNMLKWDMEEYFDVNYSNKNTVGDCIDYEMVLNVRNEIKTLCKAILRELGEEI